ncbi:MAG: M14 family metallopeptidase [Clostridia bacterium]|nr:M14 family metallopeptidase [Clostridia bacterium]
MNTLNFTVKANHLELTNAQITTEGSVNYDQCVFSFDSEWDGYDKTAVFSKNKSENYRVALDDNKCKIPAVCLESDGYIKIGVYGISPDSDIIISTNSVAHYVNEGVQQIGDFMENDSDMVFNAVAQLKQYAKEYTEELDKKFESLSESVGSSQESPVINSSLVLTDDWFVPDPFDRISEAPQSTGAVEPDAYLDFMINPLVDEFSDYVSKQQIGTDATGAYPIYAYSFTPPKYEKTIFISSFLHGTERIGYVALGYFLDRLCRKSESDSILNYIKNKIKLVTVPISNPYGARRVSRANGNNVDLALNFPYNWDSTEGRKGTSAADQSETQAIISLLDTLKDDKLCAVIDLHTDNNAIAGCSAYYPRNRQECGITLTEIVKKMFSESDDEALRSCVLAPSASTTLSNYASYAYGVDSCELIWSCMVHGGINSNVNTTRFTQFIGNVVYKLAKNSRNASYLPPVPFIKHYTWTKSSDDDVYLLPYTVELDEMRMSAISFKVDCPFSIFLNGYVTVNSPSECNIILKPLLYQKNSPELSRDDVFNMEAFETKIHVSQGIHILPVSSVLQAYFTSCNSSSTNYCENIEFVLSGISDSSEATIEAFSLTLIGIPCSSSASVEISRPLGLATDYTGDDVPVQQIIYPTGEYSEEDKNFND